MVLGKNKYWSSLAIFYLLFFSVGIAQVQSTQLQLPNIPQPSLLPPNSPQPLNLNRGFPSSTTPNTPSRSQQQYQRHLQQQQKERQRGQQLEQVLREDAQEAERRAAEVRALRNSRVNYDFPTNAHLHGTSSYRSAFTKLLDMDDSTYSITKAVFTTEDAFFDNKGDFSYLDEAMSDIASFLLNKMADEGINTEDNVAKNLMIYRFFADTMQLENGSFHLPYEYDFEDYRGRKDHRKLMVIKLMTENSGQCHSLPLLYLMIAEYMKAEAYLVYAPNHTYIKFPLPDGGFQNIELTSKIFNSDLHVVRSGFVKAEALQNKLYMQPLTDRQLLSENLTDLAKSYIAKYGYSPFVKEVIDSAIIKDPNNIPAHLVKSNYYTYRCFFIDRQLRVTNENFEQKKRQYPKLKQAYEERDEIYSTIDKLGYEPMPEEIYQEWLEDMQKEVDQKKNKEQFIRLKNIVRQ
ncbi:MAG: hypothetical protein RIC95_09510 [Vicingaceae bacterium]